MKVVAVTPLYPPSSRVGAWLATHAQLAHLVARGHDVTVWAYLANVDAWHLDGVEVHGRSLAGKGAAKLAVDADLVVGHCGDSGQAARVALRAGRPLVQFFHGGTKPPDPAAALVVYNSTATAATSSLPCPSVTCRPWTDPDLHRSIPGESVTLVNCSVEKGVGVFSRLARQLPHRSWLAVLGGYGDQMRPRGATVLSPTQDMQRDVWPRTRILLIPSARETWGMVGVEALASGIPVIASDLPGLRESLGDAGVFLPPNDTEAWAAEVERLHDPAEWAAASAKAKARSAELAADDPRPRFAAALEALVGVPV